MRVPSCGKLSLKVGQQYEKYLAIVGRLLCYYITYILSETSLLNLFFKYQNALVLAML